MTAGPKYKLEPSKFSWETPGPVGPFWESFTDPYGHTGRFFLSVFSAAEIAEMPLDPALDQAGKRMQLYTIASERLDGALNSNSPETLSADEFSAWNKRAHLVSSLAMGAGLREEAERRMDVQLAVWKKRFESGIDPAMRWASPTMLLNPLAEIYVSRGQPDRAEPLAREYLERIRADPRLGRASPQLLGAMRHVAEILAVAGKTEEATRLADEGYRVIRELAHSEFAKYEEEEIEAMDEVKAKIVVSAAA